MRTENVIKFIVDPVTRFTILNSRGCYNALSDEKILKKAFKMKIGKELDLSNPISFNEKMQWLKLYDHNPLYSKMVDKYEVKKIIGSMIGEEYIIPTLGVWERFEEINFDNLPRQFVLKCTHDSGGVIICKDKETFDKRNAQRIINKCLKRNYYWSGREWPYKNVKPRIIAEKYMEEQSSKNVTSELMDYKLMCFGGKVKCSFVCTERYSKDGLKVTFFDRDWKRMPFERHYPQSKEIISKPYNYEKMILLAEKLSKGIPFVRVDFYEVNQKIYFGELTFYPGSGLEEFTPSEWDDILGSWIELPGKQ